MRWCSAPSGPAGTSGVRGSSPHDTSTCANIRVIYVIYPSHLSESDFSSLIRRPRVLPARHRPHPSHLPHLSESFVRVRFLVIDRASEKYLPWYPSHLSESYIRVIYQSNVSKQSTRVIRRICLSGVGGSGSARHPRHLSESIIRVRSLAGIYPSLLGIYPSQISASDPWRIALAHCLRASQVLSSRAASVCESQGSDEHKQEEPNNS